MCGGGWGGVFVLKPRWTFVLVSTIPYGVQLERLLNSVCLNCSSFYIPYIFCTLLFYIIFFKVINKYFACFTEK